jgi:allantoinase
VYEDGRILSVESASVSPSAEDAGDCYILPGLVDTHVHVNEPGRTEWEGFRTASRAAAAGGITCIVDMPLNCIPSTTTVEALELKRETARESSAVDYAFWGGAVQGNAGALQSLAEAGVRGFKSFLVHPGIEEFTMVGEHDLREAMPIIAQSGLPLLVHAEHPGYLCTPSDGVNASSYATYLDSRPPESELEAIRLLIKLCREFRCPIHIVHLSSAKALPEIQAARAESLPITVETCPHYLCLSSEEIPDGATEHKCAPPIRDAANRELLWQALRDGLIDLIATDHSPCPPELKLSESGNFLEAWGGIASLSVALPLIWTEARRRGFAIDHVVRWMSQAPASLAGIDARKGLIAPGYDADFVIFDADQESQLTSDNLHYRHPVSPYLGRTVRGKVIKTILRGEIAFDNGSFSNEIRGSECRRDV